MAARNPTSNPASEPNPDVLFADEAARFLRVSMVTLYRWTSKRRIPFYRFNSKLLFRKSELEAYLLRNRVPAIGE